jgi:uncharacterized membrane protein
MVIMIKLFRVDLSFREAIHPFFVLLVVVVVVAYSVVYINWCYSFNFCFIQIEKTGRAGLEKIY